MSSIASNSNYDVYICTIHVTQHVHGPVCCIENNFKNIRCSKSTAPVDFSHPLAVLSLVTGLPCRLALICPSRWSFTSCSSSHSCVCLPELFLRELSVEGEVAYNLRQASLTSILTLHGSVRYYIKALKPEAMLTCLVSFIAGNLFRWINNNVYLEKVILFVKDLIAPQCDVLTQFFPR